MKVGSFSLLVLKTGTLTQNEETELEQYLALEHFVRLANAQALQQIQSFDDKNVNG